MNNYSDPKADPFTTPVQPTYSSLGRSLAQEGPLGAAGGRVGGKGEGDSSISPSCIVIKFYFILPRHAKYRAKYKFK